MSVNANAPVQTDEGVEYTQSPKAIAQANGSADVSEITVRPTTNGGFAVSCRYKQTAAKSDKPVPYVDPDEYAFSSAPELMDFFKEKFAGASDTEPTVETGAAMPGGAD